MNFFYGENENFPHNNNFILHQLLSFRPRSERTKEINTPIK